MHFDSISIPNVCYIKFLYPYAPTLTSPTISSSVLTVNNYNCALYLKYQFLYSFVFFIFFHSRGCQFKWLDRSLFVFKQIVSQFSFVVALILDDNNFIFSGCFAQSKYLPTLKCFLYINFRVFIDMNSHKTPLYIFLLQNLFT